ncbi:MAG: serine/threonine-protein kinase, partial [Thermoanaerobaculia bacterium]
RRSGMKSDRWREVRSLFDRLLDLPAGERAALLAAETAADPELRSEVESLLALAAEAEPFLEMPAAEEARQQLIDLSGAPSGDLYLLPADDGGVRGDAGEAVAPGAAIGAYRIVREIGHGGMGTVYLCERASGDFGQRVAIKLIRRGMDTALVVERFLAERRILSALEHPNIARLIDGGTTADGRPYFVMEYIEGEALLDYCDKRRLTVADRLRLFREVCRAVQYAHQRLVVHRDLKPTNILVTSDGIPKLLDFGLSRVLNPDGSAETRGLTALGLRMMTPEYASPEQARGELVTTASDVYSLGILLFELLTGRRPYRIRSRRAADLERAICDEIPERPSTAAAKGGEIDTPGGPVTLTAKEASEVRDGSVARLRRALAGDIDNIVLKALKKEPERRYSSAGELAEDIRRHLAGLPVMARPDTLGYRASKFVRRHAVALSGTLGAAVLLAILIGIHTSQLSRERDRAEMQATESKELATFLASLFELSDLDRTRGQALSARDILDRGAARIESDLGAQPQVAAKMMQIIANVYRELDLNAQARPLLEGAVAALRRLHGEENLDVATAERNLGALLHALGDEQHAEELLRQAIRTGQTLAPGGVDLALARGVLANTLKRLGQYPAADAEFRAALAILDKAPPPDELALAKTLGNYGLFLETVDLAPKGVPYLRRTLEIEDRVLGPESPSAGANRLNLGIGLRLTGAFDEAIAVETQALAIAEKSYGRKNSFYGKALNELGSTWSAKGDVDRAGESYRASIPIYEEVLGPDHPDTVGARRNLAILLAINGREREALPEFQAVLASRERRFGPDHPAVAESLFDVANARRGTGDLTGVEAMMRRGLAIYRAKVDPDSSDLACALSDLAEVLCAGTAKAEGLALLAESKAIVLRAPSPSAPPLGALDQAISRCGGGSS